MMSLCRIGGRRAGWFSRYLPSRSWRPSGYSDGTGHTRDPIGDGSFVEARVAEDEAGPPRRGELEIGDGRDGDALVGGRCDDGRLVEVVGQPGDEMQAGRDPNRLELGQVLGQCGEERVAAAA